jgi:glutaconate CoA-transferase subunit B
LFDYRTYVRILNFIELRSGARILVHSGSSKETTVSTTERAGGGTGETPGGREPCLPLPVEDRRPVVSGFASDEMMTVAASRRLVDGAVCFVGIGLPSAAANLARETHAPNLVLIYESGTIGAKPTRLPLSIGDGELAETADMIVSVPEIFNYWLQGGRIDVGFLSAAQIDRFANLNSTVIGPYAHPTVRLPGGGGAPEIAASCREVVVVIRQNEQTFVEKLDFITSVGHGSGPGSREQLGFIGKGPVLVITDLGLLRPNSQTFELELTHLHPGVSVDDVRAATAWDLLISPDLAITDPPSANELAVLRRLESTKGPR